MAVEAVGEVVLRKLTDLLIHDSIAFDTVIDELEDIRIQLRRMRGYLVSAELEGDPTALSWATEYLRVLFSAEDDMENHALSLAAQGRRNAGFFQRRGFPALHDFFGPCRVLRLRIRQLTKELKTLESTRPGEILDASLRGINPSSHHKPQHLLSDQTDLEQGQGGAIPPVDPGKTWCPGRSSLRWSGSPSSPRNAGSPRSSSPDLEGPVLIGFTHLQRQLVDRLKTKRVEGAGVIALVGPPGSGKTTLVQTIYNLREVKAHFDCRAWVHASDESVKSAHLLANLMQQLLKSNEGGNRNHKQLLSCVRHSLQEKKTYLIVLDHVSTVDLWDKLKSAFPNLATGGSKVILITRHHHVAKSISQQVYPLAELSEDHSFELFTKKSCRGHGCTHLEKKAVTSGFLSQCKAHYPLDIVLLGGLLSTKGQSCHDWDWYLSSQDSWSGKEIRQLSYDDLPAYSKLCLLYMTLFPNEADISVRRLHRLWLAEGFIQGSPGISEEDSVEDCFDDLVQRNFIQISKLRSDGSPRRCRLPRALRDYLSQKARLINLFNIHHNSSSSRGSSSQQQEHVSNLPVRRLVEYVDIKNSTSSASYENLRSYLSFNFQRNDTPAKEVGNFICKIIGRKGFGALRVLDLENVYKPTLPETLKQLFHLRYLGLRWTFIDHLPKSVGELTYLETLDLKQTYINSLPSSIRKLKHLRHLNLPGIRLDYNKEKHHSSLTELRTLVGLIVDDETTVKDELDQLRELRELDITCQSSVSEDLMKWIQKLTKLRFLWLKSKNIMGRPAKIELEPLCTLPDLSHLSLLGNIVSSETFPRGLPTLDGFPPNLKVLALSVSRLEADPMHILSQLPHLSVLRLLADSYLGTEMKCPENGFKNLRVLKLWMLRELVDWTVEQGCMPQLKELNIRQCPKLSQLPIQLLQRTTLEELTLTTMPEEFVQKVKSKKQSHTLLIENDYKFTPLPWEKDPELWKSFEEGDPGRDDAVNGVREREN